MKIITIILSVFYLAGCGSIKNANNSIDQNYNPTILNPAYSKDSGPAVYIDEGHNNYHTMNGMYKPFAILLKNDGYRVEHAFGVVKNLWGYRKVRYKGIAKNATQVFMLFTLSNFYMARKELANF